MGLKIVKFIFFGNYFIGLLALVLTLESTLQLQLPFNSIPYYLLICIAPIVYYTYAYIGVNQLTKASNPRTEWFLVHQRTIRTSQLVLTIAAIGLLAYLTFHNFNTILQLPLPYWLMVGGMLLAALLYYGLLPSYFFNLNLRNTGWLKPFIIGFVWACTANLLPLIALRIEQGVPISGSVFWVWLFVKNWMFCTVNAIMFDMKDYEIDANRELKTFAVRFGIQRTISYILIPLLFIGMVSLLIFTHLAHFHPYIITLNAIPFLLTAFVAYSMHQRKQILFYLIVIDGLILVKALCGILGALLFRSS